jgi:Secretion system C-terminal sorting domain
MKNLLVLVTFLCLTHTVFAHWGSKGPYGGKVKCMVTVDTTIFVGTADGGIFRTTNSTATAWKPTSYTGLTYGTINAFVAIGTKIVAATPAGIFISADLGTTWTISNTGLTTVNVLSLAKLGTNIFAGTSGGGVFISANNGATWRALPNVGLTNKTITALVGNEENIFAGTENGMFGSSDDGDTWTAINLNLPNLSIKNLVVASDNIFAGTSTGVFVSKVWIWSVNWVNANTGLSNTNINGLSASGDKVYAATNKGVFVSPNTNGAWSAANTGYADTTNAVLVFNNKLFAGTQRDGLYKSNSISAVSWAAFNTGFNNLETFTLYNSNQLVIAATNKGLFVSRDLAANYTRANKGLTDSLNVTSLSFAGTKLFAGTRNGGMFVSADTGKTWTSANNGLTNNNILKIITVGANIIAAAGNGTIFISPAAAINWQQAAGAPTNTLPTALATDGTRVFLGTSGKGVYASTGGTSWTAINNGLSDLKVTALAVAEASVFVGTMTSGVLKNDLAGTAWTANNNGLPTKNIVSLCATGQWVVAGYKGGVYATFNKGATWVAPNVLLNLPEYADVKDISFSTTSTRIFVATPYNSIYSNATSELPIATATNEVDNAIGHLIISPNPSFGAFTINANHVKGAIKSVTIHNTTGAMLQYFPINTNEKWIHIAINYPKGMYFVTIHTNDGSATQKLIME